MTYATAAPASTRPPASGAKLPPLHAPVAPRLANTTSYATATKPIMATMSASAPPRDAPSRSGRLPPTASSATLSGFVNGAHTTRPTTSTAAAAVTAAASGKTGPSSPSSAFVVFPELPDQLLCAPDNSIWVYGQYALSFFASEAAAQAKLEKKVRAMMREAQRHYEVSRAFFFSLSPQEQRSEVLRSAQNSSSNNNLYTNGSGSSSNHLNTNNNISTNNSNNFIGTGNGHASRFPTSNSAAATGAATPAVEALTASEEGVYRALREAWPKWGNESTGFDESSCNGKGARSSYEGARHENEGRGSRDGVRENNETADAAAAAAASAETVMENEVAYPPGLRVHLVLDIIASRKTLGATPLKSRAYRVAEGLYRRVMLRPAAASASAVTLGNRLHPDREKENVLGSVNHTLEGGVGGRRSDQNPAKQSNFAPSSRFNGAPGHDISVDALRDIAAHVRTFILGISDTDITLVGRDVVCPYKHLPTPSPVQVRLRNTLELLAEAQHQQQHQQRPLSSSNSPAAATANVSALLNMSHHYDYETSANAASPSTLECAAAEASFVLMSLVTEQIGHRHSMDALLPAPLTRVPPTLLSQLDQTRLILCAPPVDWSAEEEA